MKNDNTILKSIKSIYIIGHLYILYTVIIFWTVFVSFKIQAGQPHEYQQFTVNRNKTSEVSPSTPQTGTHPYVEVSEQEGIYQIKAIATVRAPATHVRNVLTDYVHIYRLNPSIIESEVLNQYDDGSVNVRTSVLGCAGYFCEELERVERVRELPSGDLHAEIIPELSQFKSGQTSWRIKANGEYCEIIYQSNMEPDVFIPPVVGEFLLKKSIIKEMQVSFANLEKISSILAEREWHEELNIQYQVTNKVTSNIPCNTVISQPPHTVEWHDND